MRSQHKSNQKWGRVTLPAAGAETTRDAYERRPAFLHVCDRGNVRGVLEDIALGRDSGTLPFQLRNEDAEKENFTCLEHQVASACVPSSFASAR